MPHAARLALLLCLLYAAGCHHYGYHGGPGLFHGGCHVKAPPACGGKCAAPLKASCCGKGGCGLLHGGHGWHGCHAGCGEISSYEWLNDPPDCCDPCHEYYGFWTGPQGHCRRVIIDPVLWVLALKHKHCRWHHEPCPYGYNYQGHPGGGYGYTPCNCAQCCASQPGYAVEQQPSPQPYYDERAPYQEPLPTPAAGSHGGPRSRVAGRLAP